MHYEHYPPKGYNMFVPKVAYFKDNKSVYFLSPFKILVFEKITVKGIPMSENFYYRSCWEYEQIILSPGAPKSLADIAVSIRMHFTIVIVNRLWGAESILK